MSRAWVEASIARIEADFNRSADTHLIRLPLPAVPNVHVYLKDESTHITGSLKHRLARSLFLHALCNGWIGPETTLIEASSGSTAVSEAYFAQMLGLPFVAVMARSTSRNKIELIERQGGSCCLIDDPREIYAEAQRLARECNGHYLDQFTFAERATDWRGNNNIAESIYRQMAREPHPIPSWIVTGAGTGGTSATIGRFARYYRTGTRVCLVDPEQSVFHDYVQTGDASIRATRGSMIEGIGRPRVEPSFIREIIDRSIKVPDVASFAAIHWLRALLGRACGGSTGTNLWGVFQIAAEMHRAGTSGSIVTLICDSGERYLETYFNDAWLAEHGFEISPQLDQLREFHRSGRWPDMPSRTETDSKPATPAP